MATKGKNGGVREGAGRPFGTMNKRTKALADVLEKAGDDPAMALVRLAKKAEHNGEKSQAVDAWRSVLPYVCPTPRQVEVDADGVLKLARAIADIRKGVLEADGGYAAALARATHAAELKECIGAVIPLAKKVL